MDYQMVEADWNRIQSAFLNLLASRSDYKNTHVAKRNQLPVSLNGSFSNIDGNLWRAYTGNKDDTRGNVYERYPHAADFESLH